MYAFCGCREATVQHLNLLETVSQQDVLTLTSIERLLPVGQEGITRRLPSYLGSPSLTAANLHIGWVMDNTGTARSEEP